MLKTFETYTLRNFQTCNIALVTAVTMLSFTAQHSLISFLEVCDMFLLNIGSASEIMSTVLVSTDLTPGTQEPSPWLPLATHRHQVLFLLWGSHRKFFWKVGDSLSPGGRGCVWDQRIPLAQGWGLRLPLNGWVCGEWLTIIAASGPGSPEKSGCFSLKSASHINSNERLDRFPDNYLPAHPYPCSLLLSWGGAVSRGTEDWKVRYRGG